MELIRKSDTPHSATAGSQTCPTCGHTPTAGRTPARSFFVAALMGLSGLYLLNPGLGIFELLPDALPLVGALDEGLASAILLGGLRYFGVDALPFKLPLRRR